MFTTKDVAEYYNTTQNHYESWWGLKNNHSLHYGLWNKQTKNFDEALKNTNQTMAQHADVKNNMRVLDAGCGVGGAAIFLATHFEAKVTGITLSERQVKFANTLREKYQLEDKIDFQIQDYTQTNFPDASFDVIWACESVSSAPNKEDFIKEAYRLLKKGGKLVMVDFFHNTQLPDPKDYMKRWGATWGINEFPPLELFTNTLAKTGFTTVNTHNYTKEITKSAKKMYHTALFGAIPSELYNITHPGVSRFAKTHYKCGILQYKALKKGLWDYFLVSASK